MTAAFRIQFVLGVTPDKWARIWSQRVPATPLELVPIEERDQLVGLREGTASMCFVRLPIERDGLHVIPLYREGAVVVVARDHAVAAFDEVAITDLADEPLLQAPGEVLAWQDIASPELIARANALPPMTAKQAIAVAATGAGMVIVPLSVARALHRKDVVHRPVTGVPDSEIGLAWRTVDEDPRLETFIGIVRGRTARSSRGGATDGSPDEGAASDSQRVAAPGRGTAGSGRTGGKRGRGANDAPRRGGTRPRGGRAGGHGRR